VSDQFRYDYMINRSHDYVTLISRDYRYEFANDAYCEAIELDREEVVGRAVADVCGDEQFRDRIREPVERCLAGETIDQVETLRIGGAERRVHVRYYPYGENGETTHALGVSRDITRLNEIEARLTQYEFLDPVTGLFNRRSLNVVLEREIFRAHRSRQPETHAVMHVALHGFGEIHQSFGAEFADILLENTGLRVRQAIRESDYVFRFEGTDLTVLLVNISHAGDVGFVAEKIHDAITVPYKYQGMEVGVTARIGIAIYPDDGDECADLIRNANSAVLDARKRDLTYSLYNRAVHEEAIARVALKTRLVNAFDARQFVLHYQPFVDVNGVPVGAEALIRWNHPERGLLYPASFIGLAEETRLVSAIDKWALYEVCRQLGDWSDLGDFYVSVNISARDLLDEYLVDAVQLALQRAPGVSPHRLKLELTERISMHDPERSIRTMRALADLGVEIWIDDFGTGQSSLAYLKHLPAAVLKIDKVFIAQIVDDHEDLIYLESIVRAIRSRGKRVVIEGVTDAAQAKLLRSIGCELMQGYYFSEPVPAGRLREIVAGNRPIAATATRARG